MGALVYSERAKITAVADYIEIKNQVELDEFLDRVQGFHDGMLKEIHGVSRGHVRSDLSMIWEEEQDLRLLVQRQWQNPSACELILVSVQEMRIGGTIIDDSTGTVSNENGTTLFELVLDDSRFVCERVFYRDCPDWMGPDTRYGESPIDLLGLTPEEPAGPWVSRSKAITEWSPR